MSAASFEDGGFERLSSEELEAREAIEADRGRRVLLAVAELAHRGGIAAVTTPEICRRARLRPGVFHDLFASRDSCLRWALLTSHLRFFKAVRRSSMRGASWFDGMDAALGTYIGQIAAEPLLAELCLLHGEAMSAGASGFDAARRELEAVMTGGRAAGRIAAEGDYREPAPELEEFLARAILWLVALRIQEGEAERLRSDCGKLVALAAGAFFGVEGTASRWREMQRQIEDHSGSTVGAEKHNDPGWTARGRRSRRP